MAKKPQPAYVQPAVKKSTDVNTIVSSVDTNLTASPDAVVQQLQNSDYADMTQVKSLQSKIGNYAVGKLMQAKLTASAQAPANQRIQHIAKSGVQGQGNKLPYYEKLQQAFGEHDLSQIEAYTNPQASVASNTINAEAYATGNKIAFAESNPSLHTVAHETAHIVQQREGIKLSNGLGKAGDVYEHQADQVANAVVQGHSAQTFLPQVASQNTASVSANSNAFVQRKIKVGDKPYQEQIFTIGRPKGKKKHAVIDEGTNEEAHTALKAFKLSANKKLATADMINAWAMSKEFDKTWKDWQEVVTAALEELNAQATAIAQIELGADNKINNIILGGRGISPYTNAMGNHTTGWLILVEAVKTRLNNKTFSEAVTELEAIVKEAESLPGMNLKAAMDEKPKAMLEANQTEINQLITDAKSKTANSMEQALLLQQAISSYFNFRNLIPLTTINDSGGKGRGEAKYLAILRSMEESDVNDYASLELAYAIWHGLLDPKPINAVIGEEKEAKKQRSNIAPGLKKDTPSSEILAKITGQHFTALKQAFPKTMNGFITAHGVLGNTDESLFNSLAMLLEDREKLLADSKAEKERQVELNTKLDPKRLHLELKKHNQINARNPHSRPIKEAAFKKILNGLKPELEKLNESSIEERSAQIKLLEDLNKEDFKDSWQPIHDLFAIQKNMSSITDTISGLDIETSKVADSINNQAVQIILGTDNKIKAIKINRDDESGLSGTKGAHTTSYIVHIDAITQPLIGKSLDEAKTLLLEHAEEAREVPIIEYYFKASDKEGKRVEAAEAKGKKIKPKLIFSESQFGYNKIQRLETNEETILTAEATLEAATSEVEILLAMQSLINHILMYLNAAPFATTYVADTTGHGEGSARRILIETEKGFDHSKKDIIKAIWQLFDEQALHDALSSTTRKYSPKEDVEIRGHVFAQHINAISIAYPKSVEKSEFDSKANIKAYIKDTAYAHSDELFARLTKAGVILDHSAPESSSESAMDEESKSSSSSSSSSSSESEVDKKSKSKPKPKPKPKPKYSSSSKSDSDEILKSKKGVKRKRSSSSDSVSDGSKKRRAKG